MAVTNCAKDIPVQYFILMQLVIFLPFALIRNLAKLSTTALVADVFILAGLIYIFSSEFSLIAERGVAKVVMFNEKNFPLMIGYVVYLPPVIMRLTDSLRVVRRSSVSVGCLHFMYQPARALTSHLEGIGLIIPITDSMKEPRKFPKVLSAVMIFLIGERQTPHHRLIVVLTVVYLALQSCLEVLVHLLT